MSKKIKEVFNRKNDGENDIENNIENNIDDFDEILGFLLEYKPEKVTLEDSSRKRRGPPPVTRASRAHSVAGHFHHNGGHGL